MKILAGSMLLLLCSSFALAQDKPRVFITDSKSWEIAGGGGGTSGGFGGGTRGGARPQTAEIIKTFAERCREVIVNSKQEKADYVVLLDHEGGKSLLRKDNKVAVFKSDGDSILSRSTRSLGNSVQNACEAINQDWAAKGGRRVEAPASATAAATASAPEMSSGKLVIASTPPGADIEIDGAFVGNTPSSLVLPPGEHTVAVKKAGFKPWERKLRVTAGDINLSPELEKLD